MPSHESGDSRSLDQLQRWMQSVITHPAGIEAGTNSDSARLAIGVEVDELDDIVCRSQRLNSADRLRIYGNAYFTRLLECLRAEFPALVQALGEEAFDGLAFGYLLEHPSQSYTLARLAAGLPEYLAITRPPRERSLVTQTALMTDSCLPPSPRRGGPGRGGGWEQTLNLNEAEDQSSPLPNPPHRGEGSREVEPLTLALSPDHRSGGARRGEGTEQPDFADFLIDLAILERTYSEVFDGPGPEQTLPLKSSDLEGLSVEQFAESRFGLFSCVRLLPLRFPVHEYATAVRHGEEADFPEARPTYLVVTRRDYIVRRFEVSPIQFALLAALQRGSSMGEALLAIQPPDEATLSQLATDLRCWFHEWTSATQRSGLPV